MKKYCFMMTGSQLWLDVAFELHSRGIAEPVFWLGDDRHLSSAKEKFGDVVLSMNDFVHYQHKLQDINFDGQAAEFFTSENYLRAKDRCLKMMDRLDLYGLFSRQDREVIFNKLAICILDKLDTAKPQVLIMAEMAHSHAQYLVLEICLYLDLEIIKFNNWMLAPLLYMQNVRTGERYAVNRVIDESLSKQLEVKITEYVSRVLEAKELSSFELDYMKKQRLMLGRRFQLVSFLKSGWIQLVKETWFQFRKNHSSTYYNINPYGLGFLTRLKIKRSRTKNLLQELNRKSDQLSLKKKFVYFGLHFEPERTTNPDGGVFHDQILAIIALRKILPSEVEIIVKEHPSQFYIFERGSRGRSPLFYDLLKNIKGVQLAHYEEDSFNLIRGSVFVATITGTLALEAAILGKKGLIFGDSWFTDTPNVICWRDGLKYEDFFKEDIKSSDEILKFLLDQKALTTVPGCQNISSEKANAGFTSNEKFRQAENDGVMDFMENLFSRLPE
jgi:hypothetical protein